MCKNRYKKIVLVLCSGALIFQGLHAYPFEEQIKSFASMQKRVFTSPLFIGTYAALSASYLGWKLAERFDAKNRKPAGEKVQAFVKDTLIQAGYSPADIEHIRIVDSKTELPNCIALQITDSQLIEALELKKNGLGHKVINKTYYKEIKNSYPNLSESDLLLILTYRRTILSPDTINLLKWDIVRQMRHNARTTSNIIRSLLLCGVVSYAGACGDEIDATNQSFFTLKKSPAFLPLIAFCCGDLKYLVRNLRTIDEETMKSFSCQPQVIETQINYLKASLNAYNYLSKVKQRVIDSYIQYLETIKAL